MAYPKCPACDRAIAKVRVVAVDTDPFGFTPDDLRAPMRLGVFCPHEGCGIELQGFDAGTTPVQGGLATERRAPRRRR